jgi:hypothetical protein
MRGREIKDSPYFMTPDTRPGSVKTQPGLEPIALATDPNAWTIIDFRSLRPAVTAGEFGTLNSKLLAHIYGFDAALVLDSASPGRDSLFTQWIQVKH